MFLKDLQKEIPWTWYNWLTALNKVSKIKYDTIEWRFQLILEFLKYSDSLRLKLRDWNKIVDLQLVQNNLAKLYTYVHNIEISASIIDSILTELSFELIKENNWEFDFSIVKDIIKWKKEYSDFIVVPERVTKNNAIWSFTWLSWAVYSWQWLGWLMQLTTEKYVDILKWAKMIDELKFVEDNKELIKKEFNTNRNAYISIVKNIIDPASKSKLIEFMNK